MVETVICGRGSDKREAVISREVRGGLVLACTLSGSLSQFAIAGEHTSDIEFAA
jgi:hypothetical protein